DMVDYCGHGGRFAVSGRPRGNYQSAAEVGYFFHHWREVQVLKRLDLQRHDAHNRCVMPPLFEDVGSKAANARDLVRDVEFILVAELPVKPLLAHQGGDDVYHLARG